MILNIKNMKIMMEWLGGEYGHIHICTKRILVHD